jgi:hypothetical protein
MLSPSPPTGTITLETPLEELDDPWLVLRQRWEQGGEASTLTIRYGINLRPPDAANLLRLTGFEPRTTRRTAGGFETVAMRRQREVRSFSCSVIVPCRNEVGNVDALVRRLPALGTHTELIFVDGASTDGTPERIQELIQRYPERDIKLLHQQKSTSRSAPKGKAAAVFQGFDAASGEILIILDADITVAPEDLPRFYLALAEGVADFANGTRLLYPMETGAMPWLNSIGNRTFATLLSWLLGTHISDTLCGTKALFKQDWQRIAHVRTHFGSHDPWGDFDLLLSAAYLKLRIVDVPVRYHARVAGESKMRPVQHGLALARTCLTGMRFLKLESRK